MVSCKLLHQPLHGLIWLGFGLGTNLATGSQTETSLSAENTGTSVALLQETNNQAGITGPSSLLESSQLLARSPAKESWLAKTAGLFDVVIQEYNTPSILIGPGAPVRATTMRERTPLGLFRVIMMANTSFLADMITKLSSMLDRDSRKNLASTSSAMNNLVHRNINLKRLAAQDQEITSKKKAKMAKTARKGALKDQKRSKSMCIGHSFPLITSCMDINMQQKHV